MKEERDLKLRLFIDSAYMEWNLVCQRIADITIEIETLTKRKSELALKKMDAQSRIEKAEKEYAKFKETKYE